MNIYKRKIVSLILFLFSAIYYMSLDIQYTRYLALPSLLLINE